MAQVERTIVKKQTITALIAGSLLLTGCFVTSVHPYFTAKDLVYEPSLVGQWTNTDQADEQWTFQKDGSDAYKLTYVSSGKTNLVSAHLFKLNGQSFFDLFSADPECEVVPPPIPSHFLLRVIQITPTLRMAPMNNDWLKSVLVKDSKVLRHELIGEKPDDRRVVLVAETAELQQFLRSHLNAEDAWKDTFSLKRTDGH